MTAGPRGVGVRLAQAYPEFGYEAGDVLIVDFEKPPEPGDVILRDGLPREPERYDLSNPLHDPAWAVVALFRPTHEIAIDAEFVPAPWGDEGGAS